MIAPVPTGVLSHPPLRNICSMTHAFELLYGLSTMVLCVVLLKERRRDPKRTESVISLDS